MKNVIVVHYDEIGLKGKNRDFFEKKLISNINRKIAIFDMRDRSQVQKKYGRIVIELNEIIDNDEDKWADLLSTTFGISYFAFAVATDLDINKIVSTSLEMANAENFETFRISTHRSNKQFKLTSQQVNEQVGAEIAVKLSKKVKLKGQDLNITIEITEKFAYIYTKKINGPGGLPTGAGGKVVVLASGGIDSPVASWYAEKRGLETILVHFHSAPYTSATSIEKVKELTEKLDKYNPNHKLYLCAFADLQKKIVFSIPDKYRIIVYRRFMLRIAEKMAHKLGALALVTGESIGQVASQTLENMSVISEAVDMSILRPLAGFDKKEIIAKAQEIGTFDISILPHDDCCTYLMPKQPETKARIADILKLEESLNIDELMEECMNKVKLSPTDPF